jgi:hypothetical protein
MHLLRRGIVVSLVPARHLTWFIGGPLLGTTTLLFQFSTSPDCSLRVLSPDNPSGVSQSRLQYWILCVLPSELLCSDHLCLFVYLQLHELLWTLISLRGPICLCPSSFEFAYRPYLASCLGRLLMRPSFLQETDSLLHGTAAMPLKMAFFPGHASAVTYV